MKVMGKDQTSTSHNYKTNGKSCSSERRGIDDKKEKKASPFGFFLKVNFQAKTQ